MSEIIMRHGGNIIELSLDRGPLPPEIDNKLKAILQYTHLTSLRGVDAYDVMGNYRPTRSETRILHRVDSRGRLICSDGWRYRLQRTLQEMGHTVVCLSTDSPHPRTDRFDTDWDRIFECMDLRARQDEMMAAYETREQGYMNIPPGTGKTHLIAAYCLSHPKARIHVITDGVDIINRIYRHLIKYIPNVGLVGGGKRRFGRVTVISADSLHVVGEGFDDPLSKKSADVVIFDEFHKAGAPSILTQLAKYQNCKRYGLSGSVERFDGGDVQLEGIFGEELFSMTYQEAQALGLVVPVFVEWVKMDFDMPEIAESNGDHLERGGLWRNEKRNQKLAEKVREFADDVQVLVMVDKVDHAVHLKQFLPEFQLCYGTMKEYSTHVRTGMLDPANEPPMTPYRREKMRQQFEDGTLKKVIATDVWSTGVDFTGLSVLARADGRGNDTLDTQIPCRANRVVEGKPHALIIDCMDGFQNTLLRRSNARKRNYIKKGWQQLGLGNRRIGVNTARWNRA